LICLGEWPRADATVRIVRSTWMGLGHGHGHLTSRLVDVEVQQSGPMRQASLWLPALDQSVVAADEHVVPLNTAKAG